MKEKNDIKYTRKDVPIFGDIDRLWQKSMVSAITSLKQLRQGLRIDLGHCHLTQSE